MTTSTTLAAALVALQAEMPAITKDRTATVTSQKGSYKYAYAGLDDVSRILQPLLAKHGFAFTSMPTVDEGGRFVLAWQLLHVSGESLDGAWPLPPNTAPQLVGSVITYARRYCLCAVTGAVATEDDDGQAAASTVDRPAPAPRKSAGRKAAPAERSDGSDGALSEDAPRPLVDSQRRRIMALWGRLEMSGDAFRDARLALTSEWLGRPVASTNDLSMREAATVTECLEARLAEPPAGADEVPS